MKMRVDLSEVFVFILLTGASASIHSRPGMGQKLQFLIENTTVRNTNDNNEHKIKL